MTTDSSPPAAKSAPGPGEIMAAQRTELAMQRNRFAADRTMMAIMRTSLSMISFGFTIFSFFNTMAASEMVGHAVPDQAPGRFGLMLVVLGVVLLVAGIIADVRYMAKLRRQHQVLADSPFGMGFEPMNRSMIVISAILLLFIGLLAIGLILARL
jgi:putative membrane protein